MAEPSAGQLPRGNPKKLIVMTAPTQHLDRSGKADLCASERCGRTCFGCPVSDRLEVSRPSTAGSPWRR